MKIQIEKIRQKVSMAYEQDNDIICAKADAANSLGSNPDYLKNEYGITKSDLIRLERLGLAVKARYETKAGHRVRWLIFSEVLA